MKWLLSIALAFSTLFLIGQESSFRAELDTPLIRIGEQLNLTWELQSPAQNEIAWPSWNDTLKGIELLQSSAIDTSYDEENIAIRILRQTHQITSFDSGYYAIHPVYAVVNDSILGSNALLLSVQNVQLDSALVMRDIKGPMEVDYGFWDWLKIYWPWVLLSVLGLILIALVIYFISKKKDEKIEFIPSKPKIPAHITALEKLKNLEDKKLWQSGEIKEYHSELSEIVREFIEARFSNLALEMTTPEILKDLKGKNLAKEPYDLVADLLPLTDMAKFAKLKPIGDENETAMKQAVAFVQHTKERKEDLNVE